MPAEDMKIAGVSLGTSFDAVKASLGQPTGEKRDGLPMEALNSDIL